MRFDFVDLTSAKVSPEGWVLDKPVISRAGVFEYRRADGSVRREYRPPEEVFKPESMRGLRGIPVTDGHPGRVDQDNPYAVIGAVLSEGERADSNLVAEIVIHNPKKMGAKRELSLGYNVDIEDSAGTTPDGKAYDVIQRNIRVNHLAVVERGRAGNARLRLDADDATSFPTDNSDSKEPAEVSQNLNLVDVRVDGLSYKASPEVARHLEKLTADAAAASKRADGAEAERDTLKAAADKHKADIEKARADATEAVRARLTLEAEAKARGVEVKADQSDRQVREAVIAKLRGTDMKFDGKSDDYVASMFDLAVADADASSGNARKQAEKARADSASNTGSGRSDEKKDKPPVSARDARARMIASYGG